MPDYVLQDPEFQERVVSDIKHIKLCNDGTPPALLWDTIKASLRGITIKYTSELK